MLCCCVQKEQRRVRPHVLEVCAPNPLHPQVDHRLKLPHGGRTVLVLPLWIKRVDHRDAPEHHVDCRPDSIRVAGGAPIDAWPDKARTTSTGGPSGRLASSHLTLVSIELHPCGAWMLQRHQSGPLSGGWGGSYCPVFATGAATRTDVISSWEGQVLDASLATS